MLLYKGKGDKHDMNNYYSILIMPPLVKLYSYLVHHHMLKVTKLRSLHAAYQSGFQKQHHLKDSIQLVMCDIQTAKAMGSSAVVVFIDLEKVYDRIDFTKLMHALKQELGILDNILLAM